MVGARSLRVRLGCFTNLHRQSSRNPVPRIIWTLELQRWPHTSDACGLRPYGCVMAAHLHVCSLGTFELESARADLDNHLLMGLDRAWHTILILHLRHASRPWMPRALAAHGKENFSRAKEQPKNCRRVCGGLWYSR